MSEAADLKILTKEVMMAVYVDTVQISYGRMKMCHMLADTLPELLAMADLIGIDRKHYQGFDKASCPHFDVCKSKRALAVEYGAAEVSRRELVEIMKTINAEAVALMKAGHTHGWGA